jgi:hypothetical protein
MLYLHSGAILDARLLEIFIELMVFRDLRIGDAELRAHRWIIHEARHPHFAAAAHSGAHAHTAGTDSASGPRAHSARAHPHSSGASGETAARTHSTAEPHRAALATETGPVMMAPMTASMPAPRSPSAHPAGAASIHLTAETETPGHAHLAAGTAHLAASSGLALRLPLRLPLLCRGRRLGLSLPL